MKFNSGNPELPHLPGAGASPMHGGAVWSTFFSVLGRAKTPLSRFWHSLRSASPGYSPGQPGRPWPMPVPYPGLHKPGGRRGDRDVPRKLALNATVLVLSWLYLGQPGALSQPGPLALGSTLSKEQWAIVGTLERNTEAWNSQPLVALPTWAGVLQRLKAARRFFVRWKSEQPVWLRPQTVGLLGPRKPNSWLRSPTERWGLSLVC